MLFWNWTNPLNINCRLLLFAVWLCCQIDSTNIYSVTNNLNDMHYFYDRVSLPNIYFIIISPSCALSTQLNMIIFDSQARRSLKCGLCSCILSTSLLTSLCGPSVCPVQCLPNWNSSIKFDQPSQIFNISPVIDSLSTVSSGGALLWSN